MKTIELKASAKINLSIDVLSKRDDGYHEVAMVMQQIDLWDFVSITYDETDGESNIRVSSNADKVPDNQGNLCWKAAKLMQSCCPEKKGNISIYIKKRIPVGAGLGGGSADAAAVLHGLNILWKLNLPPSKLMAIGVQAGADVPFLIMSQAASNPDLISGIKSDLSTCALAEGIGERLTPLPPLKAAVLLKKPDISISTKEIYESLDLAKIKKRPKTKTLIEGLHRGDFNQVAASMYNVLAEVAAEKYPVIAELINEMKELTGLDSVMMSGSGPTVFALVDPLTFPEE